MSGTSEPWAKTGKSRDCWHGSHLKCELCGCNCHRPDSTREAEAAQPANASDLFTGRGLAGERARSMDGEVI